MSCFVVTVRWTGGEPVEGGVNIWVDLLGEEGPIIIGVS